MLETGTVINGTYRIEGKLGAGGGGFLQVVLRKMTAQMLLIYVRCQN